MTDDYRGDTPVQPVPVYLVDPKNLPGALTPPGWTEEQLEQFDGGSNWSGALILNPGATDVELLRAGKAGGAGMIGLATVYVTVFELGRVGLPDVIVNQRLILTVSYNSGRGGDDRVQVDATGGCVFSVPAGRGLTISASIVTADPTHGFKLRVEATVAWGTSVSGQGRTCYSADPQFNFPATGAGITTKSGFIAIQRRSTKMIILIDDVTQQSQVFVEFYRDSAPLSPIVYATPIPSLFERIPIVAGVRFYKLVRIAPGAEGALNVTPAYELGI